MALTLAPRAEFLKDNQTIRIVDTSDYVGEAIDPADVRGILTITDPNLIAIVDNADFDNPDIEGAVSLTSGEYALNLDAGEIVPGTYEIVYSVDTDFDDIADYTITINVTYSEELIPTVSISVVSSLVAGTISSTDVTDYSAVTLDTRTHSITFPASKGSIVDTNVSLNENISSLLLYIGDNIAEVTSGIIVKVSSENWIYATITDSVTHEVVDSSNISGIRESYQTFYDQYVTALEENRQSLIILQPAKEKIDESYNLWALNTLTGNPDEATIYVDNIIEILNVVGIPTDPVVPDGTLVNAALPGFATQWLFGAGAPNPSDGRDGDFYINTITNQYYNKAAGDWGSAIGTLGANTIIEFSADGATGWTTTYANGLNWIRFSGDGGVTYTDASKFIDGYTYYAYTSDGVSADFIATDDPGFTFNPVLEYIAQKKFDESHNGDLVAGDFTGLFTKYRDAGIIVYSSNPSVSIQTDKDGNNPVFPVTNPMIYVYDGDNDVTSSWTMAIDSTVDVTASVINDNEIDITAIAADNGSITISCSRSGYDDLNVMILVSKTKAGQAIIDATSVDDSTIEFDVPTQKIRVKDDGITGAKLNAAIVDDSTIELAADVLGVKDEGITEVKLDIRNMNRSFIKLGDSNGTAESDGSGSGQSAIAWMDVDRIAYTYLISSIHYLACLEYDQITDTWAVIGTPLTNIAGGALVHKAENLGNNRVVIYEEAFSRFSDATVYTFNGSTWNEDGSLRFDDADIDDPKIMSISSLDEDSIFLLLYNQPGGTGDKKLTLQKYQWGGSSFSQVGSDTVILSDANIVSSHIKYDITTINADTLYVFYEDASDSFNKQFSKYTFNGTTFDLNNSTTLFSSSSSDRIRLLSLSEEEFLLYHYTNDKVYNYKYKHEEPYQLIPTHTVTNNSEMDMTKMLNGNIALAPHISGSTTYAEILFRTKINE